MILYNSLAYYEKLGFNNVRQWSDKDLSQFLFWDYIRINEHEYPNTYSLMVARFSSASQRYKKLSFLKYLIDNIYSKFSIALFQGRDREKQKILFNLSISEKYLPVILGAKNNHRIRVLTWGIRDRLFVVKNLLIPERFPNISQLMCSYLEKNEVRYLHMLIDVVVKELKRINPDYIVLWGDALPIERAIVLAAKILGITTLEIQHGIYKSSANFETGRVADYLLVWGEFYKDLYVEKVVRNPDEVLVLGYPFLIEKDKEIKKKNSQYAVCYFGEDYETYNNDLLGIEVKAVKKIAEICSKAGLLFIYRPHPKQKVDILQKRMPEIVFVPQKEKMKYTFKRAQVYISFSSTALIEATMQGKITLQLTDFPIRLDNFENLGICSKSFKTIDELRYYLVKIANSRDLSAPKSQFNNHYIETRYQPGKRFLEIIEEIKKKKNNNHI